MAQPGFVYILVNPSANEFLKIGKTERDPEARAKELSSATGVPTPFYVAFQSYFQDCTRAEAFVHERLAKHRVASNREFFRVPLRQAIDAILEAERILGKALPENEVLLDPDDKDFDDDSLEEPWQAAYDEAENYYYGHEDTLQDYNEALRLYKQAVKLGCIIVFRKIGKMYLNGEGCIADIRMALEYFKEGTRHGDGACWAEMAKVFFREEHWDNSDKCWNRYFESEHFRHEHDANGLENLTRGLYALSYLENVKNKRVYTLSHREDLFRVKDEMLRSCDHLIERCLMQEEYDVRQYYMQLRKAVEEI